MARNVSLKLYLVKVELVSGSYKINNFIQVSEKNIASNRTQQRSSGHNKASGSYFENDNHVYLHVVVKRNTETDEGSVHWTSFSGNDTQRWEFLDDIPSVGNRE